MTTLKPTSLSRAPVVRLFDVHPGQLKILLRVYQKYVHKFNYMQYVYLPQRKEK